MGVIKGTTIRLFDGTDPIAHATTSGMSESVETLVTASKDSNSGYQEIEPGQTSGSITFEGLLSEDTTVGTSRTNYYLLRAKMIAKTAISWKITSDVSGEKIISGTGYLTSLEMSLPNEENATFTGTITIDGAPTQADVA